MIEKQYRLNKWGTRLLKNNRPLFDWTNEGDEIVDLLNKLNDENEELKSTIKKLEAQLYCPFDSICIKCNNEYLMQKEGYYVSRCKKGHEQCSVDVKYCDDFEINE